ncbi:hypothetical protein [Runella sp.]|uniref:hypothetical protein n=1 Tax=Runella sp. TaxID=1960881 RepID=UPI003D0A1DAC
MNYDPSEDDDDTPNGETTQTDDSAATQGDETKSANNDSGAKEPGQDVQYENDTIRESVR